MERDEKLKLVYEQIVDFNKYFLDWRYKLLAGYIVILSAFYYFIFTWIRQPEHFDVLTYLLSCIMGIILSIFFMLLNQKNNETIWRHQNNGYLFEKELGFKDGNSNYGLFGSAIAQRIRDEIDRTKNPKIKIRIKDKVILDINTHAGLMNWFFTAGIASFIWLLFQTSQLKHDTNIWKESQQKARVISISSNGMSVQAALSEF